jgi:hypothetical protein
MLDVTQVRNLILPRSGAACCATVLKMAADTHAPVARAGKWKPLNPRSSVMSI